MHWSWVRRICGHRPSPCIIPAHCGKGRGSMGEARAATWEVAASSAGSTGADSTGGNRVP